MESIEIYCIAEYYHPRPHYYIDIIVGENYLTYRDILPVGGRRGGVYGVEIVGGHFQL